MPLAANPQHLDVDKAAVRAALLAWYDRQARDLPWRVTPERRAAGARPDPYRVWLSEIMLQQTTVAAVKSYFEAFLSRWPNIQALAAAPREEVLQAWAGLGYYARARNLHAAAAILARQGFPDSEEKLRALPGVGAYTAAAIAAIALDRPANVVDGNIKRVTARLFAVRTPMPEAKAALKALAGTLVGPDRPGDWAQALMDLGATICTPRAPDCPHCPIRFACRAHAQGAAEIYPVKRAKAVRPLRHGVAFLAVRSGKILLARRPDEGLLGGMLALPATPFRADPWARDEALAHAPPGEAWEDVGAVRHVFTHFALQLAIWRGSAAPEARGTWWDASDVRRAGLPTAFRKAAILGLSVQP